MAVPAYTTDLTDIADLDTTGGTAVEPAALYTAGRSPDETATDGPIQGTVHASLTMNTTGKAGVLVPGTAFTHTSGEYIFGWIIWLSPGAIATYAAGGLSMILGSSATNFDVHWVGGKDFGKYPYGGWQNFVVDPERTPEESNGTSPTAYHYVGAGANVLSQVSKGDPLYFDVFRYGRGIAKIDAGQAGSLGTFAGLAAINDANTARWGLFQSTGAGSFQWKGLMSFGSVSACLFTDSNVNISIENTELVSSDFNRIEINNTSSVLNWTNVNFSALGTVAKGELEMIDDCEFNDNGGVFTDMSTFIYDSNYTGIGRTWRRCGQVTQGGGTFTSCVFDKSSAATSLVVDDLSLVTKCQFNSDGSNHAINLGTISSTQSVSWDNLESDYAATDGSTGNETIVVSVNTGITLTINVAATGSTPTIKNDGVGTVVVVAGTATLSVTAKDQLTGTAIEGVAVTVKAKDATGPFPYKESVTLARSALIVTVTHTGHGYATGNKVEIEGAIQNEYNRIKTITVIDTNSYSYLLYTGEAPTTPATGTITANTVLIDGKTNASGVITDSRTYGSDQPVEGHGAKGTSHPVYKRSPIADTVDSANGLSLTLLMIED